MIRLEINFDDVDSFYDECERGFNMNCRWGRNLDALADILRGGFFHEDDNFVLIWKNSNISKQRLDHKCRVKQLKEMMKKADPGYYQDITKRIIAAENEEGPTTFDNFVSIMYCECREGQFKLE